MGVYTDKFLKNFNVQESYYYKPNFDPGTYFSNAISVYFTEAVNYNNMLKYTFNPQEREILEAKVQVLYEFGIKDIFEKIKSFFRWIKDQIKRFFAWVRSLFKKTKTSETKSNAKKADSNAKSIPKSQSPTQGADQHKKEVIDEAKKAVEKGEDPKPAIKEKVKEIEQKKETASPAQQPAPKPIPSAQNPKPQAKPVEEQEKDKAIKFIKRITSNPILYLKLEDIITKDFVPMVLKLIDGIEEVYKNMSNKTTDEDKLNSIGDNIGDDIDQVGENLCFSSKIIDAMKRKKEDVIDKSFNKSEDKENNRFSVSVNIEYLNKAIDVMCVERMDKVLSSLDLDDLSTYTNWFNKEASDTDADIKYIDNMTNSLETLIVRGEKSINGFAQIMSDITNRNFKSDDENYIEMQEVIFTFRSLTSLFQANHNVLKHVGGKLQTKLNGLNTVSKDLLSLSIVK